MKLSLMLKILIALIITLAAAFYQRMTGPTHPVSGDTVFEGNEISYRLLRSHAGEGDQPVEIKVTGQETEALVVYRRYKSGDSWTGMKMKRDGDRLAASLPHQPPAGKLEYFVWVGNGENAVTIPVDKSLVTRFTGYVPMTVLIPHIIAMFAAMLISNMAGIEALTRGTQLLRLSIISLGLLIIGGMILGPVVQKFAFDAYWTGFPFGTDLTDNKTLIAVVAWIIAVWRAPKNDGRIWVIIAAVVVLLVYLIPHSVMGSELDYKTMEIGTGD